MWMLWHKLFGWHYVEYRDLWISFVARVIPTPSGKVRMVTPFGSYSANLLPNGQLEGTVGRWSALTFDDDELHSLFRRAQLD